MASHTIGLPKVDAVVYTSTGIARIATLSTTVTMIPATKALTYGSVSVVREL